MPRTDPVAQDAVETYVKRATDIDLVGIARDGEAAVAMAAELRPDVALVDIHLPTLDGWR
ncbi:MAG: hypothetical protein ACK5LS_06015 [Propioniciclava sp.]